MSSIEYRTRRLEDRLDYLYCYVKKNSGGGTETDPIFTASPAHSITQADIDLWNAGAVEVDTLETVVNRGAYSPKPISFLSSSSNPTTGDPIGAIGVHKATYSYYFGDFSQAATGLYNVSMSYGALQKLTSGDYNIGIGVFAGKEITTGKSNTFIGSLTGQKTTTGNFNTMFGRQAGNENTTGYKNTYFGTYAGYNNSTSNLNVMIGYKAGNQTPMGDRNLFLGSFAGQGVTGTNNLILGIGAGNGDGAINNRLIIHNNTTLSGYGALDSQEGVLGTPTQGNLANALITGAFDQRWVKFNGTFIVGSAYMPNAQGDATYTKNIVAKPDGTFGWEDKQNLSTLGGVIPSIKILDYSQDATNYMLRVSYSYGQGSPTLPMFEVAIHSAGLRAQDITIQSDGVNQSTSTISNIPKTGFVSTILIPKATNTSPAWNNDIVGIMVTLLGVDNGDGGASSTKIIRRVVSDMDLIGNIRPKLRDNYEKFTTIRDVTYTADATNYYINGRLNVAVQANFANNNSFTLNKFYLGTTEITGTGITVANTASGNFLTSIPVNDINGNPTTLGYTSIPFRITIPKATNPSGLYNNNVNGLLSFVLQYSSFGGATHVPLYIPYTIPALFTSPSAIQATTINASALPNAQGDAIYTKSIVAKADGTFGTIDRADTVTSGTTTLNTAGFPGITTYVNTIDMKNSFVHLYLDLNLGDQATQNWNAVGTIPTQFKPAKNTLVPGAIVYTMNGTQTRKTALFMLEAVSGNVSMLEPIPGGTTGVSLVISTQYIKMN